MIQYSTRDILNKAKQLADLENSDFISYSESLTLLNDAYSKVYQTAINAGDLMYVKKLCLEENSSSYYGDNISTFKLPNDFYQLYSIRATTVGAHSYPIPRHVKDGHDCSASYEIKNDKLIIYSNVISEIEIEYYPIPSTLFVKRDDLDLSSFSGKPLAYYKDTIITYNPGSFQASAYNLIESETVNTWSLVSEEELKESGGQPVVIIHRAYAGYNGLIIKYSVDGKEKTLSFDYDEPNNPSKIIFNDPKIVVRQDDGIFLDSAEDDVKSMLITEDEVFTVNVVGDEEKLNNEILLPGTENMIDILEDDKLFITNKEGKSTIYDINKNEVVDVIGNRMEKIICVGDNSLTTGYGALSKKAGRSFVIKSLFNDTVLDYPNNLYFTMLSYMLAISYKIKQNADIAPLSASYDETVQQYYDMLRRDGNAPLRINNSYR